jgi:hypothetical protein
MGDHFQDQMEWVQGLSGQQRIDAGAVVAWQCTATTLNELVKNFNTIVSGSDDPGSKHDREVQLKKVIIGMLYEMDKGLDLFAGMLKGKDLLDQDIKDKKREFKTACKKVGLDVLKNIRNGVAFHFGKTLEDPEAIIETYLAVDQISMDAINEIMRAANICGYAMRDKIIRSLI